MQVEVDARDVDEYEADDRGRINLGIDHAGDTVTVAIVEVEDADE